MTGVAAQLADWAAQLRPTTEDIALADHALIDTVAVTLAASDHPIRHLADELPEAGRWATIGHVLDFDDLHIESTTHVSVVIGPAVLATGGDANAYLAGAGVMTRLGLALGWQHYQAGWHATCTAGAPAAAVAAGLSLGLGSRELATAMALAVPAAGGLQRAFGTQSKALQVGFAAAAGVRAARLAGAGATADPLVVDDWLALLGADPRRIDAAGPTVPGGLAVKLFPCCYAMQRPIAAVRVLRDGVAASDVHSVEVRTPEDCLQPLIHDRPSTGLESKFSMPYAVATGLLDGYSGFAAFTDDAVRRPAAVELMEKTTIVPTPSDGAGEGLLEGDVGIEVRLLSGDVAAHTLKYPLGSPENPCTDEEFRAKISDCLGDSSIDTGAIRWDTAASILRETLPIAGRRVR